ncbi:MAG: hypothetical protein J6X94_05625 [Lachnospiraceae bacterium]|nr:hypothetical protein [Lachnospiraceae bacterium]
MKITRAEGYKKPNYAVAVAATMAMVTITGCGIGGPDLEGATTLANPEEEIQYAGDISVEQMNNVIDYDGGLEMYTEPDEEIQLEGEIEPYIDESLEDEDNKWDEAYAEPLDDELVLEGGVTLCEPEGAPEPPMLEGSIELSEP